ncbi:MAG TPA: hypothetical protein VG713_09770 [Pirellulales bacterium]|nr:hypothetical protein [Pirellulales bacterium]
MRFALLMSTTLFVGFLRPAAAEEHDQPEVIELVLAPAANKLGDQPHLIYLPSEQSPGNAALLYLKAMVLLGERTGFSDHELTIVEWLDAAPRNLPTTEVRKVLADYEAALHQCRLAARRSDCEWELALSEEQSVLRVLLPEAQKCRSLARLIALEARLAIVERRFDAAIESLRVGYALARHIARQPFLVSGLVGLSIAGMMTSQIELLVEIPETPNLYWALTELPRPIVDMTAAIELESRLPFFELPQLRNLRDTQRSPQQWDAQWQAYRLQVAELTKLVQDVNSHDVPTEQAPIEPAAAFAREKLRGLGYQAEAVATMPVAEVLLRYAAARCEVQGDAMSRAWHLPLPQALHEVTRVDQQLQADDGQPLALRQIDVGALLLPAIARVAQNVGRAEQRAAALRAIEVLRDYAATHEGKLPATLDDIGNALPLPADPATGKPLAYTRRDGSATIMLPALGKQGREYRLSVQR